MFRSRSTQMQMIFLTENDSTDEKLLFLGQQVSVVIPVYNSSDKITECLNSIANQSVKPNEIIIIDDGSTDDTFDKIREWQNNNQTLNIIYQSQENSGPSKARNRGVQVANGKLIAFLDSDDSWHENKLKYQLNLVSHVGLPLLIGTKASTDSFSNLSTKNIKVACLNLMHLIYSNQIVTSSVIIDRDSFLSLGGFDILKKFAEDERLWFEFLSKIKDQCFIIDEKLVLYSNSSRNSGRPRLSEKFLKMEFAELDNLRHLWSHGHISLLSFISATSWSFLKFFRRLVLHAIKL